MHCLKTLHSCTEIKYIPPSLVPEGISQRFTGFFLQSSIPKLEAAGIERCVTPILTEDYYLFKQWVSNRRYIKLFVIMHNEKLAGFKMIDSNIKDWFIGHLVDQFQRRWPSRILVRVQVFFHRRNKLFQIQQELVVTTF